MRFLTLLFFCVFIIAHCQFNKSIPSDIICKYRVSFLKDSLDESSRKEEVMTLLIGNKSSLYKNDTKYKVDSMRHNILNQSIEQAIKSHSSQANLDLRNVPKINIYHEVLKQEDKVFVFDRIFTKYFVYENDGKVEWRVTNETKKINNFNCLKALGKYNGREYVAWFAKDVPIPEGPYVFKGLPGLVVQIEDNKKLYFFQLISLEKKKSLITPMQDILMISREKFIKTRNDSKDNAIGNVKSVIHRSLTKEEEEQINRNAHKNNNFLD